MKNKRLEELEKIMNQSNFWNDKVYANKIVKEYESLKNKKDKYINSSAVITIIAGSGGDDAEDFAQMLANMYIKYCRKNNFEIYELHKHENEKGGYKNITLDINKIGSYKLFKNETGVHRLVRISPFNAKKQRHTSFALVEVIPKIKKIEEISIPEEDLKIEFTTSSGPGGQNVNRRETAVRATHIPSGISVRVESERSQAQNKEKALEIINGKIICIMERKRLDELKDLSSNHSEIEWGNQIRSYVLHPYKLVKDYRIDYESRNPELVLDGEIEDFLRAFNN